MARTRGTRPWATPEARAKAVATVKAQNEARKGSRVVVDKNGCWIWQWATRAGYPSQGQREGMYQRRRGPYPKRYALHHECGVKLCVNPAHQVPMPKPMHVELHRHLKANGFRELAVLYRIALSRALWDAQPAESTVEAR